MLIDHSAAVFLQEDADYAQLYLLARSIGRIAFPVFAFLIAQGCVYTRNIYKYALRLGILAIISEVFFDLALIGEINFLAQTNIFYTLFLSVCAIAAYKQISQPKREVVALFLAGIPFAMLAELLTVDYGGLGVMFILLLYATNPAIKWRVAVIMAITMFFLYHQRHIIMLVFSFIPIILVYFYNKKLGFHRPIIKYVFYAFYPTHLLILHMVS